MEDINTFLSSTKLLYNFSPDDIYLINKFTQIIDFPADSTIITQGKAIDGLFTILSGQTEVSVRLPGDRCIKLAVLSSGSFFGDIALISEGVATASIRTTEPTRCILLKKEVFNALQEIHPDIAYKLVVAINLQVCTRIQEGIKRIGGFLNDIHPINSNTSQQSNFEYVNVTEDLLKQENIPLNLLNKLNAFQFLTLKQLVKIFPYFNFVKLPRNTEIVNEKNMELKDLFVIIQGAVGVTAENNQKVTKLGVLGPGSLIIPEYLSSRSAENKHIPATYTTRENTQLFKMSLIQLNDLFKSNKLLYYPWHMAISTRLVAMLTSINKQLIRYQSEFPTESFFLAAKA